MIVITNSGKKQHCSLVTSVSVHRMCWAGRFANEQCRMHLCIVTFHWASMSPQKCPIPWWSESPSNIVHSS